MAVNVINTGTLAVTMLLIITMSMAMVHDAGTLVGELIDQFKLKEFRTSRNC